jgi:hypothetical protein
MSTPQDTVAALSACAGARRRRKKNGDGHTFSPVLSLSNHGCHPRCSGTRAARARARGCVAPCGARGASPEMQGFDAQSGAFSAAARRIGLLQPAADERAPPGCRLLRADAASGSRQPLTTNCFASPGLRTYHRLTARPLRLRLPRRRPRPALPSPCAPRRWSPPSRAPLRRFPLSPRWRRPRPPWLRRHASLRTARAAAALVYRRRAPIGLRRRALRRGCDERGYTRSRALVLPCFGCVLRCTAADAPPLLGSIRRLASWRTR